MSYKIVLLFLFILPQLTKADFLSREFLQERKSFFHLIPKTNSPKGVGLSYKKHIKTLERVADAYEPIFVEKKLSLTLRGLWDEKKVQATSFLLKETAEFVVVVYGGLPKHPLITEDAYVLILCHEIGHHLGGAPSNLKRGQIAASEGPFGLLEIQSRSVLASGLFSTSFIKTCLRVHGPLTPCPDLRQKLVGIFHRRRVALGQLDLQRFQRAGDLRQRLANPFDIIIKQGGAFRRFCVFHLLLASHAKLPLRTSETKNGRGLPRAVSHLFQHVTSATTDRDACQFSSPLQSLNQKHSASATAY